MRLTVNGVVIRVVDRIEIEIDVAKHGEVLLNGMQVRIKGGGLTVWQGSSPDAAFRMHVDRAVHFVGKDAGAYTRNDDRRPIPVAYKLTCGEGHPAIDIAKEEK